MSRNITINDPELGAFTLDTRLECYVGKIDWNGDTVTLRLTGEDADALPEVLQTARALYQDAAEWSRRVGDFAVLELLPLKNDSWLEDGKAEQTGEDFRQRMKLTSISIETDECFNFWHDDGGLFWGHSILISGSLSEGLTEADIPG